MYPNTPATNYELNVDNRAKQKVLKQVMQRFQAVNPENGETDDLAQDAEVINPKITQAKTEMLNSMRLAVDQFKETFYEAISPETFINENWADVNRAVLSVVKQYNKIMALMATPGIDTFTKNKCEILISEIDGPINKLLSTSTRYYGIKESPVNKMIDIFKDLATLMRDRVNVKDYSFITESEINHIYDVVHEGMPHDVFNSLNDKLLKENPPIYKPNDADSSDTDSLNTSDELDSSDNDSLNTSDESDMETESKAPSEGDDQYSPLPQDERNMPSSDDLMNNITYEPLQLPQDARSQARSDTRSQARSDITLNEEDFKNLAIEQLREKGFENPTAAQIARTATSLKKQHDINKIKKAKEAEAKAIKQQRAKEKAEAKAMKEALKRQQAKKPRGRPKIINKIIEEKKEEDITQYHNDMDNDIYDGNIPVAVSTIQ